MGFMNCSTLSSVCQIGLRQLKFSVFCLDPMLIKRGAPFDQMFTIYNDTSVSR